MGPDAEQRHFGGTRVNGNVTTLGPSQSIGNSMRQCVGHLYGNRAVSYLAQFSNSRGEVAP